MLSGDFAAAGQDQAPAAMGVSDFPQPQQQQLRGSGHAPKVVDDLLQGLEDNDWDHLPAFTPPPDFS
jgi:hypothetical protein